MDLDIYRAMLPISFPVLMTLAYMSLFLIHPFLIPGVLLLVWLEVITVAPLIFLINTVVPKLFPEDCAAIMKNLRESFPVVHRRKDKPVQSIYMFHPHGYMAASIVLHTATNFTDWPIHPIKCAVIRGMTHYFGMKEVLEDRFVDSNYDDMKKVLTMTHSSLAVSPGGLDEMVQIRKKEIRVKLMSRKGIFRLAIETGKPLIPVITYGETELCNPLEGSWLESAHSFLRKYRIPLIVPSYEMCTKWLLLRKKPLDTKCVSFIGLPVLPKDTNASEEAIYELRARYIEALKKLYADTKPSDYAEDLIIE
jgi:2-acylglycerol O-acyltransferase 2